MSKFRANMTRVDPGCDYCTSEDRCLRLETNNKMYFGEEEVKTIGSVSFENDNNNLKNVLDENTYYVKNATSKNFYFSNSPLEQEKTRNVGVITSLLYNDVLEDVIKKNNVVWEFLKEKLEHESANVVFPIKNGDTFFSWRWTQEVYKRRLVRTPIKHV